jgi:hypothetical protein
MKAFVLLMLVVGLTAACDAFSEPKPSFAYEYGVRGEGENVRVTYLTQPAGLVHETVTLPWTSGEFEGPDEFIRIEADGPAGTRSNALFVTVRSKEPTAGAGRVRLLSKTARTTTRHDAPSITSRSPDKESQEESRMGTSLVAPRTFAELLIDCEEDRTLRAVLVGMLQDADRDR